MSYMVNPLYCLKCRRQIQGDAQFCPFCGHPTSTRPDPIEAEIIDAEVVAEEPSTPVAAPKPPAVSVVIQPSPGSAAAGAAIGAIGAVALLMPPLGCITVPVILAAMYLAALAIAALAATSLILVLAFWPLLASLVPAIICWRKSRAAEDPSMRKNLLTAMAGSLVLGVAGVVINLAVTGRGK